MFLCDRCGARHTTAHEDERGQGRKLLCPRCRVAPLNRPRLVLVQGFGVKAPPAGGGSTRWSGLWQRRTRCRSAEARALDSGSAAGNDVNALPPEAGHGRVVSLKLVRRTHPRGTAHGHAAPLPGAWDRDAGDARVYALPGARSHLRRRAQVLSALITLTALLGVAAALTLLTPLTRSTDQHAAPGSAPERAPDESVVSAHARVLESDAVPGLGGILLKHRDGLARCLAWAGAPSNATLRLRVEPQGRISSAHLVGDTLVRPSATACIAAEVRPWRVPPVAAVPVEVDVPIDLAVRGAVR